MRNPGARNALLLNTKRILAVAVLSMALASCNLLDFNPGPAPLSSATGGTQHVNTIVDSAIGGPLYRTLCARCHGDSGQGTYIAPQNIQGQAGMWNSVHYGSGLMPAFAALSEADVRSIEVFLAQFRPAGMDTMSGAAVYRQFCATCHGDSAGGIVGKGIGIQGDTANVTNYVHNGGATMPRFPLISDVQIAQLKQFLLSFSVPTDGAGLFRLYCASCHGADAQGALGSGPAIQRDTVNVTQYVHNGGRTMLKLSQVTDAQIALIKQFLMTEPLPTDAAGMYQRWCATCHGTDALGNDQAPGVIGKTNVATAVVNGSGRNRNGTWRMVSVPQVSQSQATLIQTYLSTLPYARTGRNLYVINCQTCHGYKGSGVDYLGNRLSEGIRNKPLDEYTSSIQNGKEDMPRFPTITSSEAGAIRSYVITR